MSNDSFEFTSIESTQLIDSYYTASYTYILRDKEKRIKILTSYDSVKRTGLDIQELSYIMLCFAQNVIGDSKIIEEAYWSPLFI